VPRLWAAGGTVTLVLSAPIPSHQHNALGQSTSGPIAMVPSTIAAVGEAKRSRPFEIPLHRWKLFLDDCVRFLAGPRPNSVDLLSGGWQRSVERMMRIRTNKTKTPPFKGAGLFITQLQSMSPCLACTPK
jgi:hypothetical protein